MNHRLAHGEALANAVIGIGLSQIVLAGFGVELRQAVALNAAMIGVSYARSYVLRVCLCGWHGLELRRQLIEHVGHESLRT